MSELLQIQPYVQRVAATIAAALKVEVEIVDNDLYRIGGTGRLLKELNRKQKRGFVNKFVLNSGQSFVIDDAGKHRICSVCELKGKCYYNAGIFAPINIDNSSIGVISIISFNEYQKEVLLRNKKYYLDFLVRMAELIGVKVSQFRTIKQLEITTKNLNTIINTLKEGIIAVNDKGEITYFNESAQNILGLKSSDVLRCLISKVLPESPLIDIINRDKKTVNREITYTIKKGKTHVLSTCRQIKIEDELVGAVESITPMQEAHKLAYKLTAGSGNITSFESIIGSSDTINRIKEKAVKVAVSSSTVLLEGESGTGKELFARAIHEESPRKNKSFIAINCSAIPDTLMESELFGYEEGAFTGARHGGKPGKFELADGGTVFLDEIGEMPLYLQSKLLRVLQEKSLEKVGGIESINFDVRIIAATNKDLGEMVTYGEFRADLYYRLSVIPIKIPPLRERKNDIKELINYFLKKYNKLFSKKFTGFTNEAKELLNKYNWYGNVRELENAIEFACNLENNDLITSESLPPKLKQSIKLDDTTLLKNKLEREIKDVEKKVFLEAFRIYGTSSDAKNKIAEALGISRATFYRKLSQLGESFKNEIKSS